MVPVDGAPIHISESGAGSTVIFESGMGEGTATWNDVLPAIAKFAHTVAYDRPGIGQSPTTTRPRRVTRMAADLHDLLHTARIAPPYVLVGHSLGVRSFKSMLIGTRERLQAWFLSILRMEGSFSCCIRG